MTYFYGDLLDFNKLYILLGCNLLIRSCLFLPMSNIHSWMLLVGKCCLIYIRQAMNGRLFPNMLAQCHRHRAPRQLKRTSSFFIHQGKASLKGPCPMRTRPPDLFFFPSKSKGLSNSRSDKVLLIYYIFLITKEIAQGITFSFFSSIEDLMFFINNDIIHSYIS